MSDYAIVETGSKQYKVERNSRFDVELLEAAENAKEITLDKVLLVKRGEEILVGNPLVKDAKVVCEYLGEFRAPKVVTFKYRRRKNSRRIRGHRQNYTSLRVKEIIA